MVLSARSQISSYDRPSVSCCADSTEIDSVPNAPIPCSLNWGFGLNHSEVSSDLLTEKDSLTENGSGKNFERPHRAALTVRLFF